MSLTRPRDAQIEGVTVSIESFGASTSNTAAENDTAINAAIATLTAGQRLLIPNGSFEVNAIVFAPPDDCAIAFHGELVGAGSGVALTIGSTSVRKNRYIINGAKVRSKVLDRSAGRVGIRILNLHNSTVDIRNVYGFESNIIVEGINSIGNSYNEYHLGRNVNGTKLIHLKATSGGWSNQNTYIGGWLDFTSEIVDFTGCVGLTIDHNGANIINSNVFINTSFEGNAAAKAFEIHGHFNQLLGVRHENVGDGEFTSNSLYNIYMPVYDFGTVTDNGARNKILVKDNWTVSGSNETDSVATFQNKFGAAYKGISVLDAVGNENCYVLGNGTGFFKSNIHLFQTAYGIYTGTGSPEGVVTASVSSVFMRRDGGDGTSVYIKESGTGNTGWIPIGSTGTLVASADVPITGYIEVKDSTGTLRKLAVIA